MGTGGRWQSLNWRSLVGLRLGGSGQVRGMRESLLRPSWWKLALGILGIVWSAKRGSGNWAQASQEATQAQAGPRATRAGSSEHQEEAEVGLHNGFAPVQLHPIKD